MVVPRPTPLQLTEVAQDLGMHIHDSEVAEYLSLIDETMTAYDIVDRMPDYLPEVQYPRTGGYRPEGEDNLLGAWYVKCSIKIRNRGKLAGKKVALKDTICLAGVPMMNGASVLEGYTPDVDAAVVTRLLEAGAEIAGKANTECFSYSGASHTSATGPVHNPYKMGYSAGGSSSGCAALVGAGEVDIALGGDQAGSIRIPASHCGIYGLKPTYGLIPYTGILSQEFNVDHTGPMTASVADNALALEVLAGEDGIDPRQRNVRTARYRDALDQDIKGLKVAVVPEGFRWDDSDEDVDAKVEAAAERLAKLGARPEQVSIPLHRDAWAVWLAFGLEGYLKNVLLGNSFGTNHGGLFVTSLNDALADGTKRADEFSPNFKVGALAGHFMSRQRPGHYYCKALNLVRKLRAAYDAVLNDYDVLLMPAVPMKAKPLVGPDDSLTHYVKMSWEGWQNLPGFDLSHHPALTVPCGMGDGLPIGMMLVAKHFDEQTIYRAAHAFERSGDWHEM